MATSDSQSFRCMPVRLKLILQAQGYTFHCHCFVLTNSGPTDSQPLCCMPVWLRGILGAIMRTSGGAKSQRLQVSVLLELILQAGVRLPSHQPSLIADAPALCMSRPPEQTQMLAACARAQRLQLPEHSRTLQVMHNKGPRCRAIQQAKQTDAEQLLIDQQSVWVQLRVHTELVGVHGCWLPCTNLRTSHRLCSSTHRKQLTLELGEARLGAGAGPACTDAKSQQLLLTPELAQASRVAPPLLAG